MSDPRAILFALVVVLPFPGCCTLARLFCGPDDSEWVQIDYSTPLAGVTTFKEAIRRDNCRVIYDSLGEEFKRQRQIGLLEACVFWDRLKEEQVGVHLLGYAEVTELESTDGRVAYELQYSGYRFRVDLVPYVKWAVFTSLEHAPEVSDWAKMTDLVRWPQNAGDDLVLVLPDPNSKGPIVDQEDVLKISVGPQWKVDRFEPIEDSN